MKESRLYQTYSNPVVIGGVGGSGTRLIAECLNQLGFFTGEDLNPFNDNLWFTLLFKHERILSASAEEFAGLVEIFVKGMSGGAGFTEEEIALVKSLTLEDRLEQHSRSWLRARAKSLLSKKRQERPLIGWGWKEPNSHIVMDRLSQCFSRIKYIHVARNGLDMAHSSNQNQLKFWGKYFLGNDYAISPRDSLKYWCIIHRRVLDIGRSMNGNFLFLNYDDFCSRPESGIARICSFLELDPTEAQVASLKQSIKPPASIGRFKTHGTHIFDPSDVQYVKELGFDVLD